ncbi:MAG: hypothetical protein HRT35_05000 [Algicola sp.]|nr:hypothetical protein [Algicola sp.]
MKIVFDMDNTLTDDFGRSVRPGMVELLRSLVQAEHQLVLWTSSAKARAKTILADHELALYFCEFIYREDYDPKNLGLVKDIRQINGNILIDDAPDLIKHVRSVGKKGFLISPYRRAGQGLDEQELVHLRDYLKSANRWWKRSF